MVTHPTLLSLGLALLIPLSPAAQAETIEHAGTTYWIYRVEPGKEKIELHLSEKEGIPNTFPKLETRLQGQGRRLKFAMNAGIFEGTFRASGLHIAEGKTITKLNLDDFVKRSEGEFTPNFFLKPNGVFFIRSDGSAAVVESHRYATLGEKPVLATQSGPLLVEEGTIHPTLTPDSTSKRYRNGVGVTKEGTIIFACSVLERDKGMSNLYRFAEFFRDKVGCPNTLYLDGDISYVYIRDLTGPIQETNWFAGILAITEPLP
jgi:uncharacterized protein YigE (DUF2233 family)